MSKPTLSKLSTRLAAVAMAAACSRDTAPTALRPDAAASTASAQILSATDRAEDSRRADLVPAEAMCSHDASVRRRAARAFARILDADDAPLLRALEDEDPETAAWAAYGLGESCKEHEESHVRALAARLVSMGPAGVSFRRLDARVAIERALGRCGGDLAEQTLRASLERPSVAVETAEAASYGLGDIAASRGVLAAETQTALLDAAEEAIPLGSALYPFGRAKNVASGERAARLLAVARAALARPGPERIFAVRALEESGDGLEAPVLARVLASDAFTPAERSEAARALARLGGAGQAALADTLAALAPGASERLAGDGFGVLLATAGAVDAAPPNASGAVLRELAIMQPPLNPTASVARRVSALRCMAAGKVARAGANASEVRSCDLGDGEAGERAWLSVLDRAPLTRERQSEWLALARQSRHVRVREKAIDLIARHPELGAAARAALAEALTADVAGLVTAAALVVTAHPARVFASGARQIDPSVAAALSTALARPWSESLVETRVALVDAGLATGLDQARAYAEVACRDANVTVRARAAKALSTAGDKNASCPRPRRFAEPAPEIGHTLFEPVRVVFETDAGPLGVRFDPALAPIAVTRLVALARSGFYTAMAIHRVVPGFVTQLGDPEGDGYGGSGQLLRCETSPVPFAPFDVGVALAGRDTGSSQIFVTLARYPHLDGQYTWAGHADGDWSAAAEGDVIRAVRIED